MSRWGAFGELLGNQLLSGIARGSEERKNQQQAQLAQLLESQQAEEQRSNTEQALSSLGFAPAAAASLSSLPASLLDTVVKERLKGETLSQTLSSALGGARAPSQGGMLTEMKEAEPESESLPAKEGESGLYYTPSPEETVAPYAKRALPLRARAEAALVNPALSRVLENEEKSRAREKELDFKRHLKTIEKRETKASESRDSALELQVLEDAVKGGEIGPFSRSAFAAALPDLPFTGWLKRALEHPSAASFRTASKKIFTGMKSIFGARVTDRDLKLFESMLPQIGRTEAANLASLELLRAHNAVAVEEQKAFERAEKAFPDASYSQLNSIVGKHTERFLDELWKDVRSKLEDLSLGEFGGPSKDEVVMRTPDNEVVYVPKSDVKKAEADGYRIER